MCLYPHHLPCFAFFSLQPTSILPSSNTQRLSLQFNLYHSSCAQAQLSPSHTADLYSPLFDLHYVVLHPTWLHSVECQSRQVCMDIRLCNTSSDLFSAFVMRTVSVLANSFHFQPSAFHPVKGTGTLATCWAIFCDAMLKIPTLCHISPFFTKPYKFLFSFPKLNFANVYRTQNGVWNKSFINTWSTLYSESE